MAFRLPTRAAKYFDRILIRGGGRTEESKLNLFDAYYYCALVGFALGEPLNLEAKSENEFESFMRQGYPEDYLGSRDYIAGLLIASEIEHSGTDQTNSRELEKLMTKLIEHEAPTRLSKLGLERLDSYVFRGIESLVETIAPPTSLATFLVAFCDELQRIKHRKQRG